MEESSAHVVRHRRRRTHPFRQFFLVLMAAVVVISLTFLMIHMMSKPGSSGATAPEPAGSGDDTSVQFN